MISLIPFTKSHLEGIDILNPEDSITRDKIAETKGLSIQALTLFKDNEVLGVIGGFFLTESTFQVWTILSTKICKCPIEFFKTVRNYVSYSSAHRIQISVNESNKRAIKFAEKLGFKREGRMPGYCGEGTTYYLYGRLRK